MTTPVAATVSKAIAEEIRAALARKEMSRRALSRKLDVDPMWVSRRLSGNQPISVEDVVRIADVLEVDPMPWIEQAITDKATA